MEKTIYTRNLPHWQPKDAVFDICFRLADSLPRKKWLALKEARDLKLNELKSTIQDESKRKLALQIEHDLYFGKYDKMLDTGDFGPTWLHQPEIAKIVAEAFHYRHENGHLKLICYSIMPNHVHAIFYKTQKPLFRIMQVFKTYTATEANKLLNRTGKSFWHAESYDHVIRNRNSLKRKINYQLQNPVEAGLCSHWSDWEFSFIHPEFQDWVI